MRNIKVKHPDWVKHCNIDDTVRLYKAGKIPDCIEGFMLVTPCKHLLRCVYGSDLHAALKVDVRFADDNSRQKAEDEMLRKVLKVAVNSISQITIKREEQNA
jgi:hypothetical protein